MPCIPTNRGLSAASRQKTQAAERTRILTPARSLPHPIRSAYIASGPKGGWIGSDGANEGDPETILSRPVMAYTSSPSRFLRFTQVPIVQPRSARKPHLLTTGGSVFRVLLGWQVSFGTSIAFERGRCSSRIRRGFFRSHNWNQYDGEDKA